MLRIVALCMAEITFLGRKIDQHIVSPDPGRMPAILKMPAPRNQKQLRQFSTARGSVVIEALSYKPEGRGIAFR
jgi:hypothetical protein